MVLPLHFHANNLTPRALKAIYKQLNRLTLGDLPPVLPSPLPVSEIEQLDDGVPEEYDGEEEKGAVEGTAEHDILDLKTIYISIVTPDSSVVYYKLTQGIKKPDDIPDE
jgi:hypothetical protein